ncbi:hypothetical protein [Candidatus Vidania fulgoroideorum]
MKIKNIKKLYSKEFFFIRRDKKNIKYKNKSKYRFACIGKEQATNSIIKALFYIREYINKRKNIAIITNRKIRKKTIIRKLSNVGLLENNYIYYNGIINKEVKEKKKEIVIIIGKVNSKFVKETKKLNIKSIYINEESRCKLWKPNIYTRCNTSSDISLFNILKQIYFYKKIYIQSRYKEENPLKRYYISKSISKNWIVILGIKFSSDLYIKKIYLRKIIKEVLGYINKEPHNKRILEEKIKKNIKKAKILYNEKIKIINIKKISTRFKIKYYIYDNRYLSFCFCKQNDRHLREILMNIIAYKDITSKSLLKKKNIFDKSKKLGEMLKNKEHIKFFFIR